MGTGSWDPQGASPPPWMGSTGRGSCALLTAERGDLGRSVPATVSSAEERETQNTPNWGCKGVGGSWVLVHNRIAAGRGFWGSFCGVIHPSSPCSQPRRCRAAVAAFSPQRARLPGSDGCPSHAEQHRGTAELARPEAAGTARWAPSGHRAEPGTEPPSPTHPPRLGEIGLHRWHLRLGSLLLPLILSQPLITQTVSAADGETAPLPRILSSSHSNSRRCGGFLIRQRSGSGCCQLLLALGAKDHHPLMAPTSRMGAGICRQLHHSSLPPRRSWPVLGTLGEDWGSPAGRKGWAGGHICVFS